MRLAILAVAVFSIATSVFGEDAKKWPGANAFLPPEGETVLEGTKGDKLVPPTNGRYQVFQSTLLASHTFLVDTVTGKTWGLVENKAGEFWWHEMRRD